MLVRELARDEEVDRLLLDLLRAPSPQTAQMEMDPAIREFVSDVIAPRIESISGARTEFDGMGNLLVRMGDSMESDGLLFMAYAMTFPPATMVDPYSGAVVSGAPFQIDGPCVWGRGACEQKGPLAAMIGAVGILARLGRPLMKPFVLVVSLAGETGRHDAARYILEHGSLQAGYGVVGLGTDNKVCLGHKGRLDVEIMVRGVSTHSSTPWVGINAIEGARRVMDCLDGLRLEANHASLGKATLTPTRIESGPLISHTIQDRCRLTLDRRLLPGEDPDGAFKKIESVLLDLAPWKIDVARGDIMDPSEVSENCPVAVSLMAACDRLLAEGVPPCYLPAALDAGFLNRSGMETVMFGPGDLRFAHSNQEIVSLKSVRDAARIYAATALQLLA